MVFGIFELTVFIVSPFIGKLLPKVSFRRYIDSRFIFIVKLKSSPKSKSQIQVPNPIPKSKIQSPKEKEWDWG